MQTNIHFWSHLAQFVLEWEMFQTKFVEKIKTHNFCVEYYFPQKSYLLWDNVEKYGTSRQATDGNITWRMRIACWITKVTDTHSEYLLLIDFLHGNNGYADAPHCYFICTLRLLLIIGRLIIGFQNHFIFHLKIKRSKGHQCLRVCLSYNTCQLNYINLQQYQHSSHVNIRRGNSGASRRRLLKHCSAVSGSGSAKSRIKNSKLGVPTDYTADHICQWTSS